MHAHVARLVLIGVLISWGGLGCGDDSASNPTPQTTTEEDVGVDAASDTEPTDTDTPDTTDVALDLDHPSEETLYTFANTCVTIGLDRDNGEAPLWISASADGEAFGFSASSVRDASVFFLKASDLGTYLLYDQDGHYLVSDGGRALRRETLRSDVYEIDDTFISPAEWHLVFSPRVSMRYALENRSSGEELRVQSQELGAPVDLVIEPAEGCLEHPEMSLDASGQVTKTTFENGDLYGFADTHSHILSNFGFGGGGIFHGSPFHRLGVDHAMGSCAPFHGPDGRADLLGWGFAENANPEVEELLDLLNTGLLPEPIHNTDGWPTFSEWPSTTSSTHQTQYYRWLERAWMSGMRLVVQHAVSNEAICDMMADTNFQPTRWECDDMINIDRQILEIRRMEAYIDAQHGGPGRGWMRVVESPAQARQVIGEGKLAVVLGIEVPNLFSCYLTPRPDSPECDAEYVQSQLDQYREMGVRVLFPNHKYDNAFTPGDGSKGILEVANFIQTGHWSNFVQDCPDVRTVFDRGGVQFGGLNEPRENYLDPAPNDLIQLTETPLVQLLPYYDRIISPALDGDWCQKGSLTEIGATLIRETMKRGIILEIDHLPRRSYLEVFDMLVDSDYPAAATHGNTNGGRIYEIGGISKTGFRRCTDPSDPDESARSFRDRARDATSAGLYGGVGFGFDLNGFAGVQRPRFGPNTSCSTPQENPVEYPFTSFDGDVTFTEPFMGIRAVDFNTEGMIHIGLVPELIEDARRSGATDEDLNILFRSAEAYIRMWERTEARAEAIRAADE